MSYLVRFGVGLFPNEPPSSTIELAKIAENMGFETIWVADERFYREVYSTMTLCAVNSKRIKVGTAVTDPYTRSPALTALAIATVDEISNGRAILGIGAGVSGFKQLCIKREKPLVAMKEAIDVIRRMLTGEEVTFRGEAIHVEGARLDFKSRGIPIYVGGHGPKLIELAGEVADGAILGGGRGASRVGLEFALKRLKTGAERSKRDVKKVDIMSWIGCSVSRNSESAKNTMKNFVALIVHYTDVPVLITLGIRPDLATSIKKDLQRVGYATGEYAGKAEVMNKVLKIVPDELVDLLTLAGSPEDCINKVKEVTNAGSRLVTILPFPPKGMSRTEMVKLFADEVVSPLKG